MSRSALPHSVRYVEVGDAWLRLDRVDAVCVDDEESCTVFLSSGTAIVVRGVNAREVLEDLVAAND